MCSDTTAEKRSAMTSIYRNLLYVQIFYLGSHFSWVVSLFVRFVCFVSFFFKSTSFSACYVCLFVAMVMIQGIKFAWFVTFVCVLVCISSDRQVCLLLLHFLVYLSVCLFVFPQFVKFVCLLCFSVCFHVCLCCVSLFFCQFANFVCLLCFCVCSSCL